MSDDDIAARLEANLASLRADAATLRAQREWLEAARIRGEHQDRVLKALGYVLVGLGILWFAGLALAIWGLTQ